VAQRGTRLDQLAVEKIRLAERERYLQRWISAGDKVRVTPIFRAIGLAAALLQKILQSR
jgi:hypothetical protein